MYTQDIIKHEYHRAPDEYNRRALVNHILELSVEQQDFKAACTEWQYVASDFFDNHCPCGVEIHENCHIHNKLNGNTTIVGNVCVNKFLNIQTPNTTGLKKLLDDITATAPKALIEMAVAYGYLTTYESNILATFHGKRSLSFDDMLTKAQLNDQILFGFVRDHTKSSLLVKMEKQVHDEEKRLEDEKQSKLAAKQAAELKQQQDKKDMDDLLQLLDQTTYSLLPVYYLNIPFGDQNQYKKYGIKWEKDLKKWIVQKYDISHYLIPLISVYINAPYNQKDFVKSSGGMWDSIQKKWCISLQMLFDETETYAQWFDDTPIADIYMQAAPLSVSENRYKPIIENPDEDHF